MSHLIRPAAARHTAPSGNAYSRDHPPRELAADRYVVDQRQMLHVLGQANPTRVRAYGNPEPRAHQQYRHYLVDAAKAARVDLADAEATGLHQLLEHHPVMTVLAGGDPFELLQTRAADKGSGLLGCIRRVAHGFGPHGMTFTIGRGTEVVVAGVRALSQLVVGRRLSDVAAEPRGFWREITGDSGSSHPTRPGSARSESGCRGRRGL